METNHITGWPVQQSTTRRPWVGIPAGGDRRSIEQLRDEVFAYLGDNRRLTDNDQCHAAVAARSVVVRGEDGARLATKLERLGWHGPLLIDPVCYERLPDASPPEQAATLFDAAGLDAWLELQCSRRVAAYLSPSVYVPAGNQRALEAVLEAGRAFCTDANTAPHPAPACIVVAVDTRWLTDNANAFAASLAGAEQPIALVLAHPSDPLASRPAIHGLIEVLGTVPTVLLLRTDLAAIGALAHGAVAAAIGTTTTVRHLVPPDRRNRFSPRRLDDESPRLLVPSLLTFLRGKVVAQQEGDGGILNCYCPACGGQTLRRFDDARLTGEAQRHSVLTWRTLADQVLAVAPPGRPADWGRRCQQAAWEHHDLEEVTRVTLPRPPGYLRAWAELGA